MENYNNNNNNQQNQEFNSNYTEQNSFTNDQYSSNDGINNNYHNIVNEPKKRKSKKKLAFVAVLIFAVCIGAGVGKFDFGGIFSKNKVADVPKKIENSNADIKQVSKKDDTPNYVSKVVESVMPSVVAIVSEDTKYDTLDNPVSKTVSNGTGFIVKDTDTSLYIATNNHVVGDSKDIKVSFFDNSAASAKIKGADADEDLALVEVKKSDISNETLSKLKVATIGKSSDLKIGDDVIAIGNALGYGQSVTRGIVSAVDRGQNLENNFLPLIQTDAAINPGNSGGPLVNYEGQVIGINTLKLASDKIEGIGYAIPSDIFVPELNYLETGNEGKDNVALGISAKIVSEQVAQMYDWPTGAYVSNVEKNSSAEKAGIKKGDIITTFDGQKIGNLKNLQRILRQHKPGDEVKCEVYRSDGNKYDIDVILQKKEEK